MWIYTGQSVIGTSHAKSDTPCQDAHRIEVVHDVLVATVADGAGTAKYADIGSISVTEEALALVKAWQVIPKNEQEWDTQLHALIESLREKLVAQAEEIDGSLRELATTFLLIAIAENFIAGVQIGDGASVYGVEHEEDLHVLTFPDSREYLNETVFLTSDDYQEHVQTAYVEGVIGRVALFSDGIQMLALDMKDYPPKPHLPFFRPFFEFVQHVDDAIEREQQLHDFLQSPRVCSRTDDDKTLVLAVRK
jgi:serine/threonine protein phosphatase PrpC